MHVAYRGHAVYYLTGYSIGCPICLTNYIYRLQVHDSCEHSTTNVYNSSRKMLISSIAIHVDGSVPMPLDYMDSGDHL